MGIIPVISMDLPLHPVLVHFPIALTIFLLFVYPALVLWMGKSEQRQKAWVVGATLGLLLILFSYGALFTGEQDEEIVEKVLSHELIHEHEEAAELFFYFSWLPFLVSLAGLRPWKGRFAARWLTVLLQAVLVFFMLDAAHKGGELVYEHGAARAHYERKKNPPSEDTSTERWESHPDGARQ
ncbi:MAG: hypothetical protein KDK25_06545 [Leptospiraceae bacterium]|nr:hypothetical protein [Leptospiraceae bacterium]